MAISFPPTDRPLAPPPPKPKTGRSFLWGLILGALGVSAVFYVGYESPVIQEFFTPPVRPYAAYLSKLERSQLDQTVMGKSWIAAGERALTDTISRNPPFLDAGYMLPEEPRALSYVLRPDRGQQLSVEIEMMAPEDSPQVFIELFEWDDRNRAGPQLVAYADSGSYRLAYTVSGDETYLLRIQPALLSRFSYRLKVWLGPSLAFPVAGKDSKAVRSFWGDSRDGGRRRHKGIDIFARRGTPVLAASRGRISRVRNGGLGGKTVWQRDAEQPQSLYYAHLDTQWVRRGDVVEIGDTLGLVGNTGNARTTPPHLHFGIYRRNRGAVDPFPFVHLPEQTPPALVADDQQLLDWFRIKGPVTLRMAPDSKAVPLLDLPEGTPVRRLTATGDWHQVMLPNGQKGFIPYRSSLPISLTTGQLETISGYLLDQPLQGMVIDSLNRGDRIRVLGTWRGYQWVATESGDQAWIQQEERLD